ncbi:MAG: YbaB/EbfC family nucleoid-associated protein [Armatimonadetes bacterium]|nr:YbaB/EbfC family nucleoid-associated protein [Armatimonadota bacterium]
MLNPFEALIQKQVARFQEGLQQAFAELAEMTVEVQAGDGAVTLRANGLGDGLKVSISEPLLAPENHCEVERLVAEAVAELMRKLKEVKRERIAERTPLGSLKVELPDVF